MKFYSLTETAQILGKSRQWVWILIISGRLKAEKVGKTYIISEESISQLNSPTTHIAIEAHEQIIKSHDLINETPGVNQ